MIQFNQSSPISEHKKTFKIVKTIGSYDKLYALVGLSEDCQAESYINSGSFGRVYGGNLKINAIVKAYSKTKQNQQELQSIFKSANVVYFNPSAHIINIYRLVSDTTKLQIIMQKCDHTMEKYLKSRLSNQDYLQQDLKFVDGISRGVLHFHSIGIVLGKFNLKKIHIKIDDNIKIVKIGLSSQSMYSEGFISKSPTIPTKQKQLLNDMKMFAQTIIKILWKEDLISAKGAQISFAPKFPLKMDSQRQNYLVNLINLALKGQIDISTFHKKFNKKVYKPQPKQILQGLPVLRAAQSHQYEKQSIPLLSKLSSIFIDSIYEDNQYKIFLATKQFLKQYKSESEGLLTLIQSIIQQKTQKRKKRLTTQNDITSM